MKIFNYIKASNFFPKFCPGVKAWKDKMRGQNTRGTPVEFSQQDHEVMLKGLRDLYDKAWRDHNSKKVKKQS